MSDAFAFLLPFFMGVFGIIFLSASRWSGTSGVTWGLAFLCGAAGFVTPAALERLPFQVQAIVSNAFFLTSFWLHGDAFLVRIGRPRGRFVRAAIALLGFALCTAAILLHHDARMELFLSDSTICLLLVLPLLTGLLHIRRWTDRLLAAILCLIIVETLLRLSFLFTTSYILTLDTFLASPYLVYMELGASVLAFLYGMSILGVLIADTVARYQRIAQQDPLTSLLNRRGFEQALTDLTGGRHVAGAVVLGDIDHFKEVNDNFGHAAGDEVLKGFSLLMQATMPAGTIIARFGGEEFLALLPDATSEIATTHANALRTALAAQRWNRQPADRRITASFGVAVIEPEADGLLQAMRRADSYLYDAKHAGRNQVIAEGLIQQTSPVLRLVARQ
ncbi:GGDEF domain-containing protein [Rhizobium paknamense]|uniref:diguanylate cyclase n=1 Tax=Rhizobium paknamense TaxID=1206817 RepID=A0ABU0IEJ1_9HYPH|nr:GGDEF domain-containing protein [Rhizobium paknamense]MDQ0456661.1 diguanylate cyclase (GGDEF)-like protein [Rhizobium paknamense]